MNTQLKLRLLQRLAKKDNKGFTLIELLVVVIIVGVLAAVALPNLLGQVGKARETEAKSALGSLNRAQQGYRLEKDTFYTNNNWSGALGVVPGTAFYTFANTTSSEADTALAASFTADASDPANDGTRDFAAGISYNGGQFSSILCVAEAADASPGSLSATAANGACTAGDDIQ